MWSAVKQFFAKWKRLVREADRCDECERLQATGDGEICQDCLEKKCGAWG